MQRVVHAFRSAWNAIAQDWHAIVEIWRVLEAALMLRHLNRTSSGWSMSLGVGWVSALPVTLTKSTDPECPLTLMAQLRRDGWRVMYRDARIDPPDTFTIDRMYLSFHEAGTLLDALTELHATTELAIRRERAKQESQQEGAEYDPFYDPFYDPTWDAEPAEAPDTEPVRPAEITD
jgi:hypothetical protein